MALFEFRTFCGGNGVVETQLSHFKAKLFVVSPRPLKLAQLAKEGTWRTKDMKNLEKYPLWFRVVIKELEKGKEADKD